MESIQDQTRSNLKHAKLTQQTYHDKSVTAEKFATGELVLVYNPVAHGFPKFQKHWEGPYIVISRMAGGVTYILSSADGSDKFLTVNRNRLKHCNSAPMPEQQIHHVEPPFELALVAHQVLLVPAPHKGSNNLSIKRWMASVNCSQWK